MNAVAAPPSTPSNPASRRPAALAAAALWGFAEASLFFLVPDVLLSWVALKHGVRAAILACVFAAAGAMAGGAAIWMWSEARPAQAAAVIERVPAIPAGAVARARDSIDHGPWVLTALGGAVSNTPFKLYAAAAPHAGIGLPAFVAATPLIRLPRFLAVSLVVAGLGALLRRRLSPRVVTTVFLAAWTVFYVVFWLLSPW
jgi:hypothetical protein